MVGQLNGVANYSVGNYKEAVERFEKNVELGDTSYTTCYYLGMSHYAMKIHSKAIEYYQSAYKRRSDEHHLLYNIGYSYDVMGETKSAISYYERFLKTEPEDNKTESDYIDEIDSSGGGRYYRAAKARLERLREKQFFQSGRN